MSFVSGSSNPFSDREDQEWRERYTRISKILKALDEELLEEVNLRVNDLIVEYFGDFPAIKLLLDEGIRTQEIYPILIPVTEDVLRELDIDYDQD